MYKTFQLPIRSLFMCNFYIWSMNKILPLTMIFMFLVQSDLLSQDDFSDTDRGKINSEEILPYLQPGKMRMNLEMGSTLMYTGGLYHGLGTYISPGISYSVGSGFSLHSGLHLNMFSFVPEANLETSFHPAFTSALFYAGGSYKLTERVTLTGTAFKEMYRFSHEPANPMFKPVNYQGLLMGVDFILGENFFIQGQLEISNGFSPYRLYPSHPSGIRNNHPSGRSGLR
jgi:hypothetical protein